MPRVVIPRALALATVAALCVPREAQALCLLCSCTVSASPMSFGTYVPLNNAPLDAATTVNVSCTGVGALSAVEISLDPGQSGNFAIRQMRSGVHELDYNIYSNASRTQIWGDGASGYGSVIVPNLLGLAAWNSSTPAYGRIYAAPAALPGIYSDTVLVTIEW